MGKRVQFMLDVGLSYLTLERGADTLAGGEAQRIRLATQLGSGLIGVIYILDEPTIGLHPKDQRKLLDCLLALRDIGNTVIVVEHEKSIICEANYVIDIGPGAGQDGGKIIKQGSLKEFFGCQDSLTAQYLRGEKDIQLRRRTISPKQGFLEILGARQFNLKDIDVKIPLGKLTCVTGVSGSGKSSLISYILVRRLRQLFYKTRQEPGKHKDIRGLDQINKIINITQSPIGRNVRSNPATYTGLLSFLRGLFANQPLAKKRHYTPARFSFNLKIGRCENCRGDGVLKFEMHFLPDVYITCRICQGRRFSPETLEVRYRGKSIADILKMTVDEAAEFFRDQSRIFKKLQVLQQVGLGYIQLGQNAPDLSGGEAQRIKLATELSRASTGQTLYVLDEPTSGLHFEDINRLLKVLSELVNKGNTVVIIEHNLDVIKNADWIIDLGPEGGERGGYLVAQGPVEEIINCPRSHTGRFLKKVLKNPPRIAF
jgi:excinuclease ABC subunit A